MNSQTFLDVASVRRYCRSEFVLVRTQPHGRTVKCLSVSRLAIAAHGLFLSFESRLFFGEIFLKIPLCESLKSLWISIFQLFETTDPNVGV